MLKKKPRPLYVEKCSRANRSRFQILLGELYPRKFRKLEPNGGYPLNSRCTIKNLNDNGADYVR